MRRAKIQSPKYYSRLKVIKTHRACLWVIGASCTVFLAFFLFTNFYKQFDSLAITIPTILIAGIVLLVPRSEEWEYPAWNSVPYKLEKHATVYLDDSVKF